MDELLTVLQQVGNTLATISPPTDKILPHLSIFDMLRCWTLCLALPEPNSVVQQRLIGMTVLTMWLVTHLMFVNGGTDDDASIFKRKRNTWLHFGDQFFKYWQPHAKVVSQFISVMQSLMLHRAYLLRCMRLPCTQIEWCLFFASGQHS